jgi:hypothetical protein
MSLTHRTGKFDRSAAPGAPFSLKTLAHQAATNLHCVWACSRRTSDSTD